MPKHANYNQVDRKIASTPVTPSSTSSSQKVVSATNGATSELETQEGTCDDMNDDDDSDDSDEEAVDAPFAQLLLEQAGLSMVDANINDLWSIPNSKKQMRQQKNDIDTDNYVDLEDDLIEDDDGEDLDHFMSGVQNFNDPILIEEGDGFQVEEYGDLPSIETDPPATIDSVALAELLGTNKSYDNTYDSHTDESAIRLSGYESMFTLIAAFSD